MLKIPPKLGGWICDQQFMFLESKGLVSVSKRTLTAYDVGLGKMVFSL